MFLPVVGVWNWISFKVLSSPNHAEIYSVISRFGIRDFLPSEVSDLERKTLASGANLHLPISANLRIFIKQYYVKMMLLAFSSFLFRKALKGGRKI